MALSGSAAEQFETWVVLLHGLRSIVGRHIVTASVPHHAREMGELTMAKPLDSNQPPIVPGHRRRRAGGSTGDAAPVQIW